VQRTHDIGTKTTRYALRRIETGWTGESECGTREFRKPAAKGNDEVEYQASTPFRPHPPTTPLRCQARSTHFASDTPRFACVALVVGPPLGPISAIELASH
jgi:hypothetical protein